MTPAVNETRVCTRCRACKTVDQFHRGASRCATCKNAGERSSRAARRNNPQEIRRIVANNRRRNVARQVYRASRLVEGFNGAITRNYTGTLEEYADWREHQSLGWCSTSGWRKLLTPARRTDRNCKHCGFHSGTRMYCSDRCKYRYYYQNIPSFREAERARRRRRKSEQCDNVAQVLRRLLYGGKGGYRLPELIGCNAPTFVAHMIEQMPADMHVDDLLSATVHIDHILPRRDFDLADREQWKRCWHYTNLRPMWIGDNLRRSCK